MVTCMGALRTAAAGFVRCIGRAQGPSRSRLSGPQPHRLPAPWCANIRPRRLPMRTGRPSAIVVGVFLTACAGALVALAEPPVRRPAEPRFRGLGPHHRKVTTRSDAAEAYFGQGLAFLYGFNHDEAIRSFEASAMCDPQCAMAYWGVAAANGPHINNTAVDEAHAKAAWAALTKARALAAKATKVEQA